MVDAKTRSIAIHLTVTFLLAVLLLSHDASALAASALETTGDVLEILLPATGLGATYLYGDSEGRWQWLYSGVTTIGTVEILKPLSNKVRPSGTTTTSVSVRAYSIRFLGCLVSGDALRSLVGNSRLWTGGVNGLQPDPRRRPLRG